MSEPRDILDIDEAAALLGVSVKTFNKVLHTENIPARKIGREWKFSRRALIDWVGSGRSQDFYDGQLSEAHADGQNGVLDVELAPQRPPQSIDGRDPRDNGHAPADKARSRRTAGWQLDLD